MIEIGNVLLTEVRQITERARADIVEQHKDCPHCKGEDAITNLAMVVAITKERDFAIILDALDGNIHTLANLVRIAAGAVCGQDVIAVAGVWSGGYVFQVSGKPAEGMIEEGFDCFDESLNDTWAKTIHGRYFSDAVGDVAVEIKKHGCQSVFGPYKRRILTKALAMMEE